MFDPEEHLKFVEMIRKKSELQTQSGIRTAVNRSYFSSMLKTKLRLEELGVILSTDNEIHQQILEEIKDKDSMMADKLNTLYDLRIKADYNLKETMDNGLISSVYGLAKSFNNKVKSEIN